MRIAFENVYVKSGNVDGSSNKSQFLCDFYGIQRNSKALLDFSDTMNNAQVIQNKAKWSFGYILNLKPKFLVCMTKFIQIN